MEESRSVRLFEPRVRLDTVVHIGRSTWIRGSQLAGDFTTACARRMLSAESGLGLPAPWPIPPSPASSTSPCSSSSSATDGSPWRSPSSLRYFLLLFFAALALFFRLTSPTIADRLCSPFMSSSLAASSCRAMLRFCDRDRVAWHFTTMPVGTCFNCTAELVLLIFCPPGPLPFRKDSSISVSGGGWGRGGRGTPLRRGRRVVNAREGRGRRRWRRDGRKVGLYMVIDP
jgi:hypothetical protein